MPLRGRTPVRTAPHPVHLCTHAQAADPRARTPRLTHRHTHAHTEAQTPRVSHTVILTEGPVESHGHTVTASQPCSEHVHTLAHTCSHTQSDSGSRQPHGSARHQKMPTPQGARTTSELSEGSGTPPHMLLGQHRPGGHTTSRLGWEDPSDPGKGVSV